VRIIADDSSPSSGTRRIAATATTTTFLVDGHGLAFRLVDVAYARYARQVLDSLDDAYSCTTGSGTAASTAAIGGRSAHQRTTNNNDKKKKKKKKNKVDPIREQLLLPNYMPLQVLEDVTEEWIVALTGAGGGGGGGGNNDEAAAGSRARVVVYWDGPARRKVKQATDRRRRARIDDEWDALRSYCLYGCLPSSSQQNSSGDNSRPFCRCRYCEMKRTFPKPRLFLSQIKHTLRNFGSGVVSMKYCREECDHIIARDASNDPNAFVLGNDSDFCFFPNVQYIDMSTLHVSSTTLSSGQRQQQQQQQWGNQRIITAVVIRRKDLADWMGFRDERLLVELALLCGNDYLVDPSAAGLDFCAGRSSSVREKWEYLLERQDEQEGFSGCYQLTSSLDETNHVLEFVRTLYGLGNLDRYELDDEVEYISDDDDDDDDSKQNATQRPKKLSAKGRRSSSASDVRPDGARPATPEDLDLSTLRIDPLSDRSPKDTVLRFLQQYVVDRADSAGTAMLTLLHLDVFRTMDVSGSNDKSLIERDITHSAMSLDSGWRPNWEDEVAIYVIAEAIRACFDNNPSSPFVRFTSPASIFRHYRFHIELQRARSAAVADIPTADPVSSTAREHLPLENKPLILPVDEHKSAILQAIERNRVTIIQGGKYFRRPVCTLLCQPPASNLPRPTFRDGLRQVDSCANFHSKGSTSRSRCETSQDFRFTTTTHSRQSTGRTTAGRRA